MAHDMHKGGFSADQFPALLDRQECAALAILVMLWPVLCVVGSAFLRDF